MSPITIRYPLDPTGLSPDNLVQGEVHALTSRTTRSLCPTYGAYFEDSMIIVDQNTMQPLVKGTQWYPGELYEVPTALYGKGIYAIVIITDSHVSNSVSIQYQAIGGEYGSAELGIVNALNTLELDDRPVLWPNVEAKPSDYPPSIHLHDAGDVYGFEYVVHALERIKMAIEFGDNISHDRIMKYVDNLFTSSNMSSDTLAALLALKVNSADLASTEEAVAGVLDSRWMSPLKTKMAILNLVPQATEAISGISRLATVAETVVGTNNSKATHPAGIKAAIVDALANLLQTAFNNDPNFYASLLALINTKADSAHTHSGLTNGSATATLQSNGVFTASGDIGAFSDARLKKELVVIDNALDKIDKLTGYIYFRTDIEQYQAGLIAQDLQKVQPVSVQADEHGTLYVNHNGVIALLIQGMKELRTEVNALKLELSLK